MSTLGRDQQGEILEAIAKERDRRRKRVLDLVSRNNALQKVNEKLTKRVRTRGDEIAALRLALELPGLFHGGEWDARKSARWKQIAGACAPTTKGMCDAIQKTLAREFR